MAEHSPIRGYRNWILADGTRVPIISGGDGNDPTPIPDVPEDLSALNDDELRGLHAELQGLYEADRAGAPSAELRDRLTDIRARQALIASALTERIAIANDLTALDETTPLPEVPEPAPEPAPQPAPEETPAEPVAVTAAAGLTVDDITGNRDAPAPAPEIVTRPRGQLAVVAGLSDRPIMDDAGEMDYAAFAVMLNRAKSGLQMGTRVPLARVAAFQDEPFIDRDQMLGDGVETNDRLFREAQEQYRREWDAGEGAWRDRFSSPELARTAAICTPLDIIREIPNCVTDSEPFSDSLPSRAAGRLGFQYTPSMALADISAGVGIWAEADQASVDPTNVATWKSCVAVTCPTPSSVVAEAIYACIYFDITTDMSNPERVRDALAKIRAMKARTKTGRLLQIADTFASHYEATTPYGALAGIVQVILTTLEQGEYPQRLADDTPYIFYSPPGLLSALVIDQENVTALDNDLRMEIMSYIEESCRNAGKNVRVVDLDDVERAGQTPFAALPAVGVGNKVALPGLGGTTRPFKARLIAPESALYFSTGELETGVERSPDLHRRNQAQWFMEEFVGLAKNGCSPWYTLHLTVCPNGTRAALTSPFACSTSGS